MSVNVEQEYKQVQADLKKVGDDLRAFAEQSQKEIKRTGDMHAETKAAVDQLLVTQGELKARLQAAEQAIVNVDQHGHPAQPKSWGEEVVESDAFANFNGRGRCSVGIKAAITSDQGSGGNIVFPDQRPGINMPGLQRLTVRDLLNWGRTTSNSVEFVRETGFTNLAAPVEENPSDLKPQSTLEFELASAPVATIAHWFLASKQVLADVPMLMSYIDGRGRYGLKLIEEAQLLKGSGVGLNINGIHTQATAYAQPSGASVTAETNIDRLRLAMLQVALAEYPADGIVLHPTDWANIELTKDGENRYIFAQPTGLAGPRLWGLPVVATQSMDQDDFLVGAFALGAQGWDREDVSVTIATQDVDNIRKNMVTILIEERLALTVYRPEAFVAGEFGS
jgi:HK97 family phage major capsid protein